MTKHNTTPQTVRLFNFLAKRGEVTIAEARKTLRIANPSAVVAQLRDAGARIYTNKRTNARGETVFKYRLDLARSNFR
jgi:hypothetical protein